MNGLLMKLFITFTDEMYFFLPMMLVVTLCMSKTFMPSCQTLMHYMPQLYNTRARPRDDVPAAE